MTTTAYVSESAHQHSTACWWNHLQAGWVCPNATTREPDRPPAELREVRRELVAV